MKGLKDASYKLSSLQSVCPRDCVPGIRLVEHGVELSIDGQIVGHVTTPAYSRRLGKSLALVHLLPYATVEGTLLELKGATIQCRATAARIPFVDPQRKRLHAL